jgi:hypothetical protein
MKNSKIMMAILTGMFALALQSQAQNMFQVKFKGTCQTTNANGDIVSQKLSNTTFINDAVTATGATNSSSFSVVYVTSPSTDPSVPGDFVEVVDAGGTPVYTNLLFVYSSPFPPALTNASFTEIVAGAQVVPLPLGGTGDTLGGATITQKFAKKTMIQGSFNFVALRSPTSTSNDIVKVYSGSFSANKPFVAK